MMKADTLLDSTLFQLDPTRSRCELWISAGGTTERLATGSFKPFLSQLRVAQEQIAKGVYSVRLQVRCRAADGSNSGTSWFSKGTLQRFVRFVSTPEILERLGSLSDEFKHLEEAIGILASEPVESIRDDNQTAEADRFSETVAVSGNNAALKQTSDSVNNSVLSSDSYEGSESTRDGSRKQLLRAMNSCRFMLLKEQKKAYTKAVAAGFGAEYMPDLLAFANAFGATRLRDACLNFIALSKKKQQYCLSTVLQTESIGAAASILDSRTAIALHSELDDFGNAANQHIICTDEPNKEPKFRELANKSNFAGSKMPDRSFSPANSLREPGSLIPQPPHISVNGRWGDDQEKFSSQKGASQLAHGDKINSLQAGQTEVNSDNEEAWPSSAREEITQSKNTRRHSSEVGVHSTTVSSNSRLPMRFVNNATFAGPKLEAQASCKSIVDNHENFEDLKQIISTNGSTHTGWHPDISIRPSDVPSAENLVPQYQIGAKTSAFELGSSAHHSNCYQTDPDTSFGNSSDKLQLKSNFSNPGSPSQSSVSKCLQIEENMLEQNQRSEDQSVAEKEIQGNTDNLVSKRLVRRSTSPRRKSSSPLRKVHISRAPARRPVVVIKNLSYLNLNSHDHSTAPKYRHPPRAFDDMSTGDDTDSATESEEESHVPKAGNRRLSVQAAIDLFENRQKYSSVDQKKKLGQDDTSRKSAESARTIFSEKSVPKRWTGDSDTSIESGQLNSNLGFVEDLDSAEENLQVTNHKQVTAKKSNKFDASTWQSEPSLDSHGIELLNQLRYESSVQLLERNMNTPQVQTVISSLHSDFGPVTKQQPDLGSVTKQKSFSRSNSSSDAILSSSEQETQNDHRLSSAVSSQKSDVSIEKQKSEVHLVAALQPADDYSKKNKIVVETGSEPMTDFQTHLPLAQFNLRRSYTPSSEISAHSRFQDPVKSSNIVEYRKHAGLQVKEPNADWKASIDLQPEMQSYQLASGGLEGSEDRTQKLSTGLSTGDSFIMSERHTGKGSLWNLSSDSDTLSLLNLAESKVSQNPVDRGTRENDSPGDQKGRFYEQYLEKRDAKFREESSTKRAEREAKLRAMQEVLERRKAELTARNVRPSVEKQSLSVEQWHREKSCFPPRTGLTNVNKEKEAGEKPRWEDHKRQQCLRAAQGSPTTTIVMQSVVSTPKSLRQQTSNPRTSVVRKLSPSSQKSLTTSNTPRSTPRSLPSSSPKPVTKSSMPTTPTGQRRSSNVSEPFLVDKALYRPVPSYPEPRKENTKPLSAKSGPLTQQEKPLFSRGTKPKVCNSSSRYKNGAGVLPLESNGVMSSNSNLRAWGIVEDKKPKALAVRKSIATVSELKMMQTSVKKENILAPLRVSVQELISEPSPQSKAYKASLAITVPHEVRPFLRKGRGIGPGAGPGVLKLKANLAAEAAKANDDDASSKMDDDGSDDPETIAALISSEKAPSTVSHIDHNKAKPVASNSSLLNNEEANDAQNKQVEEALSKIASIMDTESSQQSGDGAAEIQEENNASNQASRSLILTEEHSLPHLSSLPPPSAPQQGESQVLFGPAATVQQQPSQDMKKSNHCLPLDVALSSPNSTLQQRLSINENYAHLALPSAMPLSHILSLEHDSHRLSGGSFSPLASPASHRFPHLRYSLSPRVDSAKAEAVQSRKMWGNSHILSVTSSQAAPKEAPRGFKRLLNFGRKSRNSGQSNTEWVSASTSGEDDADDSKDVTSKSSEDIIRSTASSLSHLCKSADSVSKVSDTECLIGPASRSFFSLSAFRRQRP
ncbi:hypothetical protein O6H91_Y046300 [Diphasiastrum complanatum]|nr:hypothetical protein O6H91_Y046300 [Diphasiastrum complanatum]